MGILDLLRFSVKSGLSVKAIRFSKLFVSNWYSLGGIAVYVIQFYRSFVQFQLWDLFFYFYSRWLLLVINLWRWPQWIYPPLHVYAISIWSPLFFRLFFWVCPASSSCFQLPLPPSAAVCFTTWSACFLLFSILTPSPSLKLIVFPNALFTHWSLLSSPPLGSSP